METSRTMSEIEKSLSDGDQKYKETKTQNLQIEVAEIV